MTNGTILAKLNGLRRLSTGELREKYAEILGKPTSSRNKDYLFRKIAADLQASAGNEGAPSPAPPRASPAAPPASTNALPKPKELDPRLPAPGTVIERQYQGRMIRVSVLDEGFEHRGTIHRSLSAVAREATGTTWNGLLFFRLIRYAKRTKKGA